MATGTATVYNEAMLEGFKGSFDLSTDTLKLGIVDATITPAADDATPTWSDYSANEVVTTGNYTSGGETLTTVTFTLVSDVATLAADDVVIAIHASGFTDGYWGILYESVSGKAICFVDMGGPVSEQAAPVSFEWDGGVVCEFPANVPAAA